LANAAHFKEPNVRSAAVSETATVLLRFLSKRSCVSYETKMGTSKNGPTRPGTLGQANAKAYDVIVVMLAAMFLVGMALGGVLSPHESAPIQIASTPPRNDGARRCSSRVSSAMLVRESRTSSANHLC
jgi:hypothetical protein